MGDYIWKEESGEFEEFKKLVGKLDTVYWIIVEEWTGFCILIDTRWHVSHMKARGRCDDVSDSAPRRETDFDLI